MLTCKTPIFPKTYVVFVVIRKWLPDLIAKWKTIMLNIEICMSDWAVIKFDKLDTSEMSMTFLWCFAIHLFELVKYENGDC